MPSLSVSLALANNFPQVAVAMEVVLGMVANSLGRNASVAEVEQCADVADLMGSA